MDDCGIERDKLKFKAVHEPMYGSAKAWTSVELNGISLSSKQSMNRWMVLSLDLAGAREDFDHCSTESPLPPPGAAPRAWTTVELNRISFSSKQSKNRWMVLSLDLAGAREGFARTCGGPR